VLSGSMEQKRKYPAIVAGGPVEAGDALTEADAGSDAGCLPARGSIEG